MISQCRACKYFEFIETENSEVFSCTRFINRAESDLYTYCQYFKRVNKDKYVESYTKCDVCSCKANCKLIDVTNVYDENDHWFDIEGNECIADEYEEYEDDS